MPSPAAPPAAVLHATPRGRSRRLPEGCSRPRRGFCVAAGFPRCGCSLAPRRSKETPKIGDHGGKVRQPERHCLLLTDAGIPHLLEDGYRALRAPASTSMPSASTEAPGAKSSCGSLRLSRHWLPQPAARAVAAGGDNAGGNGGLAWGRRCTPWQSAGEQRLPQQQAAASGVAGEGTTSAPRARGVPLRALSPCRGSTRQRYALCSRFSRRRLPPAARVKLSKLSPIIAS